MGMHVALFVLFFASVSFAFNPSSIWGGGSCNVAEAPCASTLHRDFRSSGFTVATPMGVQRVFPSSQLIASRFYFRFGELPCESRGSQVAHQMRCKRGQLLPRMLCGSTACLNARGEAPDASSPIFSPTAFFCTSSFSLSCLGCSEVLVANTFGCA